MNSALQLPAIDLEHVVLFIERLCGDPAKATFQTFPDGKTGSAKPQIIHGTDPKAIDKLCDLNAQGSGVFVMVNQGDGKGRKAENVGTVRALFVDLDGAPVEPVFDAGMPAHIWVESSTGRYHAYWLVSDCSLEQFPPIQKAIAARFDGDKAVNDLPRVMRVPGFLHQKKEPFLSRLLEASDAPPYTVAQIVEGLQLSPFLYPPDDKELSSAKKSAEATGHRPGDDYNRRVSWSDVLTPTGWNLKIVRSDGTELWLKPGKQGQQSATANHAGSDLLFCFSDTAGLPVREGLSKFATFAHLYHGGDFGAAARELARQGYGDAAPERETAGKERTATLWPSPIDMRRLSALEPSPPKFIMQDWLPCGYATLFAGHGGIGKSGIALMLAVCIAMGLPFFGIPVERCRVLYLSCEDREGVLHWRLARICAHLGITLADLTGWLEIIDLVGHDTILYQPGRDRSPLTAAYEELRSKMESLSTQILFVDGISDTYDGNENARAEVKAYINALLALISADDGAVVLVGHVSKPSTVNKTSEGYSGSTGWHNSVRARWYLYPETKAADDNRQDRTGKLILELQKSNLGPTDRAVMFEWDDAAGLYAGREMEEESNFDRNYRDREERDGILAGLKACKDHVPAATSGQRTAYHVLSVQPNFPKSLLAGNASRKRFWRHVEVLRAMGLVEESCITRSDRHKMRVIAATDKACGDAGNA